MADRVRLRHPETGGEWECPADAVEGWKELGWEPVTASQLSGKTKAELQQIAEQRGVTLDPATSKADMVATLEGQEG